MVQHGAQRFDRPLAELKRADARGAAEVLIANLGLIVFAVLMERKANAIVLAGPLSIERRGADQGKMSRPDNRPPSHRGGNHARRLGVASPVLGRHLGAGHQEGHQLAGQPFVVGRQRTAYRQIRHGRADSIRLGLADDSCYRIAPRAAFKEFDEGLLTRLLAESRLQHHPHSQEGRQFQSPLAPEEAGAGLRQPMGLAQLDGRGRFLIVARRHVAAMLPPRFLRFRFQCPHNLVARLSQISNADQFPLEQVFFVKLRDGGIDGFVQPIGHAYAWTSSISAITRRGVQPIHSSRTASATAALDSVAIPITGWNGAAPSRKSTSIDRPGTLLYGFAHVWRK